MARTERLDPSHYGIFAGSEGLANVDEMEVEQSPDYYSMTRTCEVCGEHRECRIDWAELYCLQYGINPKEAGVAIRRPDLFDTSWVYDPRVKCFHPNYRCSCLGNPLIIFNMTPTAAERVLREAGRNGIISDAQTNIIRTISPVVRQIADAKSGVPARQVQQQYMRTPQGQMVPVGMPQQAVPVGWPQDPRRR